MKLLDWELAVMVFSVHLQWSAVAAIVNCPFRGHFNAYRTLRPVALHWICLSQESLPKSNDTALITTALLRLARSVRCPPVQDYLWESLLFEKSAPNENKPSMQNETPTCWYSHQCQERTRCMRFLKSPQWSSHRSIQVPVWWTAQEMPSAKTMQERLSWDWIEMYMFLSALPRVSAWKTPYSESPRPMFH